MTNFSSQPLTDLKTSIFTPLFYLGYIVVICFLLNCENLKGVIMSHFYTLNIGHSINVQ